MMSVLPTDAFPAFTREDWLARVAGVLKNGDFEQRLVSTTLDGVRIEPLHQPGEGPRAERFLHAPWSVVQRVDHPDAARARDMAREDIEGGASGLTVTIRGAPGARGFGLAGPDALARVFRDTRLDVIALRLDCGAQGCAAAEALASFVGRQPVDPARLDIAFGMDPLGVLAQRGHLDEAWLSQGHVVAETAQRLTEQGFRGPFCTAEGRVWHDAGASEAQELGFAIAAGVAYLRALEALPSEALAQAVGVTLAADQDMFLTLAKFRAMRLLWDRVLEACALPPQPLSLHAETSWRMMTKRDPHTNILRAVAAVFGAGLGGASSVCVLPFSLAQGLPDAFARRVARNVQHVLIREAQLWRVADPASGSGYVEHLTQALCEKAWDVFQTVERQGGLPQALAEGWVQGEIASARAKLVERAPPIIGSSAHVLTTEYRAAVEPAEASEPAPTSVDLAPMRLAERYEADA